mgnify:CR=1 FL=1
MVQIVHDGQHWVHAFVRHNANSRYVLVTNPENGHMVLAEGAEQTPLRVAGRGQHAQRLVRMGGQHDLVEGMPLGTRGGMVFSHLFPNDGEYSFRILVAGGYFEEELHTMELLIDGVAVRTFTAKSVQTLRENFISHKEISYSARLAVAARTDAEDALASFKANAGRAEQELEVLQQLVMDWVQHLALSLLKLEVPQMIGLAITHH